MGRSNDLVEAVGAVVDAWAESDGNALFGDDQALITGIAALLEQVGWQDVEEDYLYLAEHDWFTTHPVVPIYRLRAQVDTTGPTP